MSPSLFLYGNDIVERNRTEPVGFRRTWIDPNRLLPNGYLSRYFIYANPADRLANVTRPSPTVTRIQIWRPTSDSPPRYTLVWERRVQLNTSTHGVMYTVCTVCSCSLDSEWTLDVTVLYWWLVEKNMTCNSPQPMPRPRFSRTIRHTMRFRARTCLFRIRKQNIFRSESVV